MGKEYIYLNISLENIWYILHILHRFKEQCCESDYTKSKVCLLIQISIYIYKFGVEYCYTFSRLHKNKISIYRIYIYEWTTNSDAYN